MSNAFAHLANVAVLVGLVLVVIELDQNNDALVGSTQQGLLDLLHERDSWVQDPDFAAVVVKAEEHGTPLTDVEARQYAEWMSGKLNACELVYERYLEASLTDYFWEGWDPGCRALLDSAQSRRVWAERRAWYGDSFRAYIDEHVAETTPSVGTLD